MMNEFYGLVNELNNMFLNEVSYKGFPIDVLEVKGGYEVYAEIPGVEKENISVTFEDGNLTIEAKKNKSDGKFLLHERNSTPLKRVIGFGDITEDGLSAKYENGILKVVISVKEPEITTPKSITIE